MKHNRPNLVRMDTNSSQITFMDIAAPNNKYLLGKHNGKMSKHIDLEGQIKGQR